MTPLGDNHRAPCMAAGPLGSPWSGSKSARFARLIRYAPIDAVGVRLDTPSRVTMNRCICGVNPDYAYVVTQLI